MPRDVSSPPPPPPRARLGRRRRGALRQLAGALRRARRPDRVVDGVTAVADGLLSDESAGRAAAPARVDVHRRRRRRRRQLANGGALVGSPAHRPRRSPSTPGSRRRHVVVLDQMKSSSRISSTIIDSGTTFVYASTPVWKAIVEAVKKGLTTAVPSWRPAEGHRRGAMILVAPPTRSTSCRGCSFCSTTTRSRRTASIRVAEHDEEPGVADQAAAVHGDICAEISAATTALTRQSP